MMSYPFNVRVYGLLLHNNNILVSDELCYGKFITKFPGGGLQFGEGTIECLIREFKEEANLQITDARHFYTTDFFQASAFEKNIQVISIYYKVTAVLPLSIKASEKKYNFTGEENRTQSFRWINMKALAPEDFTLPIDKTAADMLLADLRTK